MSSEEYDTIKSFCEITSRCTVCYRPMEGDTCTECKEYYCECSCRKLTPQEIMEF